MATTLSTVGMSVVHKRNRTDALAAGPPGVLSASSRRRQSQVAFAARSVCDRIAFARLNRRNRTANLPSREKGYAAGIPVWPGYFLRSGLRARVAELRRFSAILNGMQPGFSTSQTAWRRERDSNPRYPFRYSSFQDCLFQPLTHPSASGRLWLVYNIGPRTPLSSRANPTGLSRDQFACRARIPVDKRR